VAKAVARRERSAVSGRIVLVGGAEWREGCDFDRELVERDGPEVVVLPTAAAYEHPERAVAQAEAWFASLGGRVRPLMVLRRSDAEDPGMAEAVRAARLVYLGGGSPLHLRSVLKDSAVWRALVAASEDGATIAGSSAGAMVLSDPMVDPRGGAFTLGLGLVSPLAVIPHFGSWPSETLERTVHLADPAVCVVGLPERTALVREPDGSFRVVGAAPDEVVVFRRGARVALETVTSG
jgi:cyanophycinase